MSRATVALFVVRESGNLWRAEAGVNTAQGHSPLMAARKVAAAYFGVIEARVCVDVIATANPDCPAVMASLKPEANPVAWGLLLASILCACVAMVALAWFAKGGAS